MRKSVKRNKKYDGVKRKEVENVSSNSNKKRKIDKPNYDEMEGLPIIGGKRKEVGTEVVRSNKKIKIDKPNDDEAMEGLPIEIIEEVLTFLNKDDFLYSINPNPPSLYEMY